MATKASEKLLAIKQGTLPPTPKAAPKQAKPKVEDVQPTRPAEATCSICGKPLSDPESIARGMGDICADKIAQLPGGMSLGDYRASKTEEKIPDGYIKLSELIAKAQLKGMTAGMVVKAVGGDRLLSEPFSEAFRCVYVGRTRYVNGDSVKALDKLKATYE